MEFSFKELNGPQVWNSPLDPKQVLCSFSGAASKEIREYITSLPLLKNLQSIQAIESVKIEKDRIPLFVSELQTIKKEVDAGIRMQIIKAIPELGIVEGMIMSWIIANVLGELYKQNENGDLLYLVTDRGGRMEKGARYSQTRQGGSYHTDGVNQKIPYEYLVFYTVAAAEIGGESIMISGATIYNYLLKYSPRALEIISQDFEWEFKGLKANEFYKEPIIKLHNGEVQWRYLRNYIEEAALKRNIEFSKEIIWAMDVLDDAMDLSAHQFRYTLQPGETLLTRDTQIFHGRTCFSDDPNAIMIDDYLKDTTATAPIRRSHLRYWSH